MNFQHRAMIPLTGYADRLSVRPAETIRFHVSNATGREIASAAIVRVISADANPAGPGIRTVKVDANVRPIAPCQAQTVTPGSYGVADLGTALEGLGALTVIATICPTSVAGASRPILTALSQQGSGFALAIAEDGSACATIGGAIGALSKTSTGLCLREGAWTRVWMTWDAATATLTVGQQPLWRGEPDGEARVASARHDGPMPVAGPKVLIGAARGPAGSNGLTFNGRIERPMLFNRVLNSGEIARAARRDTPPGLVACWDFAQEIAGTHIIDIGPRQFHGRLCNMPTRAVTGSTWSGREMCWRHATDEYAAIHFHDDDIVDCHWPATHEWTLPSELKSGSYALVLEAGEARENIPFFV